MAVCWIQQRLHVYRAQSCGILRGSLQRQVAQGGPPGHVPLMDPPRAGSCGHFLLVRPHIGSQPQARWPAVARRLRHTCGGRLRSQLREPRHLQRPVPGLQTRCSRPLLRGGRTGMSTSGVLFQGTRELELELIQPHMAQKPVLRGEVGCACVAREVSVERGGMGERGCARRLGGWVWV